MDQKVYQDLYSSIPIVELIEGFPNISELLTEPKQTLLVLDDMLMDKQNEQKIAELFTKMRHLLVSTVFITQNLYFPSRYGTTINRNAQYLVIFPNFRDRSMISTLGKQIFPGKSNFLPKAFEKATKKPYSYLFVDLKAQTPEKIRLRGQIFPDEICHVFLPL